MSSADAPQPSLGDYLSPVRLLPGETSQDVLIDGASLCLSGGGYRAMLFHLGALWRLHELDYLRHVKRISSVSGGSITSAWLGMNWEALYPATGMADFESVIVKPIRDFASQTIDEPSVLEGMLTLGLQGSKTPTTIACYMGMQLSTIFRTRPRSSSSTRPTCRQVHSCDSVRPRSPTGVWARFAIRTRNWRSRLQRLRPSRRFY